LRPLFAAGQRRALLACSARNPMASSPGSWKWPSEPPPTARSNAPTPAPAPVAPGQTREKLRHHYQRRYRRHRGWLCLHLRTSSVFFLPVYPWQDTVIMIACPVYDVKSRSTSLISSQIPSIRSWFLASSTVAQAKSVKSLQSFTTTPEEAVLVSCARIAAPLVWG